VCANPDPRSPGFQEQFWAVDDPDELDEGAPEPPDEDDLAVERLYRALVHLLGR
jgi:hypothetical protein